MTPAKAHKDRAAAAAAHVHWILTADERHARLYRCHRVVGGHWQLEEQRTLENKWEDYHEKHRPSSLGRGPTANAAQHFAGLGHELEEEHRRFARELGPWLEQAVRELAIERIGAFAAPRFLGLLREELGDVGKRVDLRAGELTRLRPAELAAHPAVLSALG